MNETFGKKANSQSENQGIAELNAGYVAMLNALNVELTALQITKHSTIDTVLQVLSDYDVNNKLSSDNCYGHLPLVKSTLESQRILSAFSIKLGKLPRGTWAVFSSEQVNLAIMSDGSGRPAVLCWFGQPGEKPGYSTVWRNLLAHEALVILEGMPDSEALDKVAA